uniref:glycosyltransferase family 2 protein n=1 Tax=Ruegeria arenilitoris TaxID=1173585 RepID=UPI00147BE2BA|nr:glycosyltransferase family 2 protein [Ruegeria arenilitoris]
MKAVAVTMVWKDYWFLKKWISYYGSALGEENLVVISHGDDPLHRKLAGMANVVAIPRDGQITADYEAQRWVMLSDFAGLLLDRNDVVLCVDVDEIVLPADPTQHSLLDVLKIHEAAPVLAPVGVEILPNGPEFDDEKTIFSQTRQALFSSKYSKPCVIREPVRWGIGGHGIYGKDWQVSPNLILAHLQYANPNAFQIRQSERLEPENSDSNHVDANALPAWSRKRRHRRGLLNLYERADKQSQPEVLSRAAELLSQHIRRFQRGTYFRYPPKVAAKHPMGFLLTEDHLASI